MSKVLIVAEHADGKLNAATAKCVKAAGSLGASEIVVAVFAAPGSSSARAGRADRRRRERAARRA